jgi:hypothetical protein
MLPSDRAGGRAVEFAQAFDDANSRLAAMQTTSSACGFNPKFFR